MHCYGKHDDCIITVTRDPDGNPLLAISGPEDAFIAIAFTDDALLTLAVFLLGAVDPKQLKRARHDA